MIQDVDEYQIYYNCKRFQKRLSHRPPIEYRISMTVVFL
ncbi:hypothetical protein [Peribacillus sp. V2I11]